MAESPDTTNPSRRLFLAAGPAAAVFGSLSATAQDGPNGALLFACRKALAAHQAYNESALGDDDDRLEALAAVENEGVEFAIRTPATGRADLKAKADLLRAQLPQNGDRTDIWAGACEVDRLTWSLIQDVLHSCAEA